MQKKQDPNKISHKDFEKLELRVGTIKAVKEHSNKKDYVLLVELGPVEHDLQVVAELRESYLMNELIGKQVVVILNIKHELVGELESEGMLLVTTFKGRKRIILPDTKVLPGVKVYGVMDGICTHMG